jgi:hypothetical protein
MLLSNPSFQPKTVYAGVGNRTGCSNHLQALDLDPRQLYAVRVEGNPVLTDIKLSW